MAGSTTILHVDDDPSFAELTKTFLEGENDRFVIETATSADAGLNRIDDRPPDCVVSDYNMPGMDGVEFLRAVRKTHPDLPFVLFTGKGSEEVASDAIAAGVTDYIQKGSGSERYALLANRIENAVRSRREAQRADRQEELMRLTEFAGDTGGFELDVDTGEILLTDGGKKIIAPRDDVELTIETGVERFHPEDREEIRRMIDRAVETGEQTRGTWRYQPPEGEQRLLEIIFTPESTNRHTKTIRGAINDITDRRERQRELRQLQQAIDNANVPITLADPSKEDDPLVYVNDGFEEMTGYPPEEMLGRNCRFLQGEDTDPEKVAALRNAIDSEETISVELRNYRKDGTEFWNRLTVSPIYDDDNLVRYLGTQEDVTERKKREQELERTRDLMTSMEELGDIGAWEYDPEAGTFMTTDGACRIHGFDPDADPGIWTVLETFHSDDRDLVDQRFDACLETGEPYEMDVRIITPDGEQRWISTRGERVNDGESGVVVRGYTRDITERKERERELKAQNERLEEFTSIVSHDLRNPLNVVGGRLELAQKTCNSDHLARAADALDRSQTLIDDLLRLAREGETVGELDPVGLSNVAESSWQTVETGSATLETHTTQTLRTDRSRFQGLLENLYRNAVEHGGDDVTVSVGAMDDGFYVADTGPGIPESERADIFEAGYSTNDEGTGFGLRIVEQIAGAHGWEITVTESEQGGARFEFTGVERVD